MPWPLIYNRKTSLDNTVFIDATQSSVKQQILIILQENSLAIQTLKSAELQGDKTTCYKVTMVLCCLRSPIESINRTTSAITA